MSDLYVHVHITNICRYVASVNQALLITNY